MAAAVVAAALAATSVAACAFHGYAPDPTPVDQMAASRSIVFARPEAGGGGTLRIVRTLAGPAPTDTDVPVTDAMTRARLNANPDDVLLMVRVADTDPWFRVAYADAAYQEVVARIIPHLAEWSQDGEFGRFQFFADLMAHPSPALRQWALLELDRADYAVLRELRLARDITTADIAAADPAFRPILVLLAGLSGDPAAADVIDAELARLAGTDLPYLGAYVIALLELRGTEGVSGIEQRYLRDTTLPLEVRERMLEAFAITSRAGAADTAEAVRAVTSDVLRGEPGLAPAVARQFGFQGDWSQAEAMEAATKAHRFDDIAELFAVSQYVALSRGIAGAIE